VVMVLWIVVLSNVPSRLVVLDADTAVIQWLAELRTSVLTNVMLAIHALGSRWTIRALFWATVVILLVFRRFRHLFVFIGAILVLITVNALLVWAFARPRPYGVEVIGDWTGFAHPSSPVAVLTATLMGMLYSLAPQGRIRQAGKVVIGVVVAMLSLALMYLAVNSVTDVLIGAIIGVTIPLVAFRLLAPNEVFPVTYRRGGSAAHLDIGGRRVKGDPDTWLFAKLYAGSHLRADRWYKLGRTLLYGRLEDEKPFNTVRRLVQQEDYALRLMYGAGVRSPEPFGVVEITPEREYIVVTEFFDGAKEIGEAEVDDAIIDDGLRIVRRLWDAGLAHRDVKPANLLVREGRVHMIDVFFAEVRPSPWRQAVDLANMMLVLATRSSAQQVYERAKLQFRDDEIAEAFAATRGITMPSQLRHMMREQGRDLHAEFLRLLPERPAPIAVQHWSVRRIGLTIGVLLAALFAVWLVIGYFRSAGLL
jgi:tRNA A-37 threonylcarbamoyl transferase component Bud32/membrane-associated phospholipid phosphatase